MSFDIINSYNKNRWKIQAFTTLLTSGHYDFVWRAFGQACMWIFMSICVVSRIIIVDRIIQKNLKSNFRS